MRNKDAKRGELRYIQWPVYLETGTMEMCHGPVRYYPDRDIAKNYSSKN